jgi:hypothetical protein
MTKKAIRIICAFAISGTACSSQASKSTVTGFVCSSADGTIRHFNVDLKKGKFDDGSGYQRLDKVTDTTITLKGPNPDLLYSPIGPIIASLELNRQTLVLTDQLMMPDRQVNRITHWQCEISPAIDYKVGRKF